MEIVALQLAVEGAIALVFVAVAARALHAFPLHRPDDEGARSGARRASAVCLLLATSAAVMCLEVERRNVEAGGELPMEPHPRGWRYERTDDRSLSSVWFVMQDGSVVTTDDPQALAAKRRAAEARNALHAAVERALVLHALVPLALAWMIALACWRRASRPARALAAALVVPLVGCLVTMTRLRLYGALTGD